MRKFSHFILGGIAIMSVYALCSCNQNDGYIGHLFGIWSLAGFSSDGNEISEDMGYGYSLRFQSNVVQYVQNLPHHDSQMFIGSWQQISDSLILEFPDIVLRHNAPSVNDNITVISQEVDFPIEPELRFKINTLSHSVLDIARTTDSGEELRYYFKKLN